MVRKVLALQRITMDVFFVIFLCTIIVVESFVNNPTGRTPFSRSSQLSISTTSQPPISTVSSETSGGLKRFYIETHGCTSNLADSDVVRAVLLKAGYESTVELESADLILTNTCSIRENAESKMFQRLKYFASLRKKSKKESTGRSSDVGPRTPMIGVLGCMAERLKESLLEDYDVDFICGPDEYRTLPDLVTAAVSADQRGANVQLSLEETYADIQPVRLVEGNVHAFVAISRGCNQHCAFCVVPYVRGVERSRPVASVLAEVQALADQGVREVVLLGQTVNSYWDQTTPSDPAWRARLTHLRVAGEEPPQQLQHSEHEVDEEIREDATHQYKGYEVAEGFTQRSKPKKSSSSNSNDSTFSDPEGGVRFAELLSRVAAVDPLHMRVRFQAPHPKDFPDEVLRLIAETPNLCKSLHMPAQHGSSSVLTRMHRGYTREAYLALVSRARRIIAGSSSNGDVDDATAAGIGLGLSSDFIAGFCGETEDEHREHLSLLTQVGFDQAFTYAYSRREQTYAGLFYQDDVPDEVKARRLTELVDTFQHTAQQRNNRWEVGRLHLVLVEGPGKSIKQDSRAAIDTGNYRTTTTTWTGRTDTNKRVVIPLAHDPLQSNPVLVGLSRAEALRFAELHLPGTKERDTDDVRDVVGEVESTTTSTAARNSDDEREDVIVTSTSSAAALTVGLEAVAALVRDVAGSRPPQQQPMYGKIEKGMYVVVKILSGRGHTLRAAPVAIVDDLLQAAALGL